jgi:hypothetical protein
MCLLVLKNGETELLIPSQFPTLRGKYYWLIALFWTTYETESCNSVSWFQLIANCFVLGEGGNFHHPEVSGLMRRTKI